MLRTREHQHDRHAIRVGQEHTGRDAPDGSAVTHLDVGVLHRADRYRPDHGTPTQEATQPEHHEPGIGRQHAEHLGIWQHRVERELQVRVIGGRELRAG